MALDDRQIEVFTAAALAQLTVLKREAEQAKDSHRVATAEFFVERLTSGNFPVIRDEILEWYANNSPFDKQLRPKAKV